MTAIIRRRPGRALVAWEPLYHPINLINEIDELARDFWNSWQPAISQTTFRPHTDLYEEDGQVVIKTELSGVKKEDIDVNLEGDILTIKAEKKQEEVTEDAKQYTGERYFGQYLRTLSLPSHVEADKASATFEDGLLEIRFPKTEKAEAKKIEVKTQLAQGGEKKRQRKRKQKTE